MCSDVLLSEPFCYWLHEFSIYFGYESLTRQMTCNYFLSFSRLPCLLLVAAFALQELFSLLSPHLFVFAFVAFVFRVRLKKSSPSLMSRSLPPMFSSRNFMFSGLTFKSLIHFELIYLHGIRLWSIFFFCIWLLSFS